ncbi:MAG: ZIP family metal transporter [Saprospirales bacterium]|nr:ZIP family metal transporter [Saprospirales bacterium]
MSFFEYLLLILSVVGGGGLSLFFKRLPANGLRLFLSFTGAFLLGISFLHLLPGVYEQKLIEPGYWVLLGFFIQLLLEQLSGGVEHGHIHAHTHAPWNYAFTVMLGLCLHAFMEGMPLAEFSHYQTEHLGHSTSSQYLLLGIVLHHAPAAFALGMLLQWSGFKATTVLLCLLVFSLMSPAGALLAGSFHLGAREEQILISLVIGSFLHISTTILFEADGTHKHRISLFKFVAILAGVLLSLATVLVGD